MRNSFIFTLCLFAIIFQSGCKSENKIGLPTNNDNTLISISDTFSYNLSTVLIDTFNTSSSSNLLAGSYQEPSIGRVSASTYFNLSLQGKDTDNDGIEDILNPTYVNTAVYDSLVLVLTNNYTYGLTTKLQTLKLYRLLESLNPGQNGSLYNQSKFSYDPKPLNSTSFYTLRDTLTFKLSDEFGREVFGLAQSKDSKVASNTAFIEYFKGFLLTADTAGQSVFGFKNNPMLRLYYHDSTNISLFTYYQFSFLYNIHFNKMTNERSSTAFKDLKEIFQEVNSTSTDNKSYLVTGLSLLPKITFPYLNSFKENFPGAIINKAILTVSPDENSFDQNFTLPPNLTLYRTNSSNLLEGRITNANVSPKVDYETKSRTNYSFDITSYVQQQFNSQESSLSMLIIDNDRNSYSKIEKFSLNSTRNGNYKNVKLLLYVTSLK